MNEPKYDDASGASRSDAGSAAENSCPNCVHENTCGYSPLAMLGHRSVLSNKPCCLGMMSFTGKPFFKSKADNED